MTPEAITSLFEREDGSFLFSRWGRPIVPVVFGVEDETLGIVKGAIEAVVALAGHAMSDTDPELGANMMFFFIRDWAELLETPGLDNLVPDLAPLVARLEEVEANQYRIFRFDAQGAILACFVFLRMDEHLSAVPADTLALGQVVQSILLWSDTAFRGNSPLAVVPETGLTILRPDIAAVIRAAYDPLLPSCGRDPSLGLRIFARLGARDLH